MGVGFMSHPDFNPYAAPPSQQAERLLCRRQIRVRLSHVTGMIRTGAAIVAVVQLLIGLSTAAVIHQEGTDAASFVAGASLMTLVISSLVGCAGTVAIDRKAIAMLWGTIVCAIAWMAFLLGLTAGSWWWHQPSPVNLPDLSRFLVLYMLSVLTVNLVISRFYLAQNR